MPSFFVGWCRLIERKLVLTVVIILLFFAYKIIRAGGIEYVCRSKHSSSDQAA